MVGETIIINWENLPFQNRFPSLLSSCPQEYWWSCLELHPSQRNPANNKSDKIRQRRLLVGGFFGSGTKGPTRCPVGHRDKIPFILPSIHPPLVEPVISIQPSETYPALSEQCERANVATNGVALLLVIRNQPLSYLDNALVDILTARFVDQRSLEWIFFVHCNVIVHHRDDILLCYS